MFGIGFSEILLIAIVCLMLFGPKKLPEVMHQAGKLFVYMRRTSNEFKSAFDKIIQDAEKEILEEERQKIRALLEEKKSQLQAEVKSIQQSVEHDTSSSEPSKS